MSLTEETTRTVAIIKNHALVHRFDIEPRILEASFEIVKERQMEFDTETDPDFLYELFGEDADSLSEGPVWVYVLERRRAVEVWNTLMGDPDPDRAREDSPNSLRALYGTSRAQNGLMGSPDAQIAEMQISSLFASSPPFPAAELPDLSQHQGNYSSVRSVSSSVLSALRKRTTASDEGYAPSNPSTVGGASNGKHNSAAGGKPVFRARPLPRTHDAPDIQPRTTRAAALRAGIVAEEKPTANRPRAPLSKERLEKTFANVPGHKRTGTITVASTAPPVVAPRMTRAASLRIGQPTTPTTVQPKRRPSSAIVGPSRSADPATFEGVPGHKRRESIAVASVKAPSLAPRLNKSAALRASKDTAPPTSFMFRGATTPKLPGLARSSSQASFYENTNSSPGGVGSRPRSQAEIERPRPASSAGSRSRPSIYRVTPTQTPTNGKTPPKTESPGSPAPAATTTTTKPHIQVAATQAPTIAPRTNKSALLRAAKMEKEAASGKPSKFVAV